MHLLESQYSVDKKKANKRDIKIGIKIEYVNIVTV